MRSVAACLLLLSGTASLHAAPVTLTDNFAAASAANWSSGRSLWKIADGRLTIQGSEETYLKSGAFADFDLEVDLRISDPGKMPPDWAGVAFGTDLSSGIRHDYLVYVRAGGALELYSGGRILAAAPTNAPAKWQTGQFVRLRIALKARHITVALDGQQLLAYDAPADIVGSIGFSTFDVTADYANLRLIGDRQSNLIQGQVLQMPSQLPAAGARVEIYNSMDGYNSLVTRQTVADAEGHFIFRDLPAGEKAYWLRASADGWGGGTGWFISVYNDRPGRADLFVVPAPRHDIWIDSGDAVNRGGLEQITDPQAFGGSRLEIKTSRPAAEHPQWRATFCFTVPADGDYVPYLAAGLYPQPYYWSEFRWSVDAGVPQLATKTLSPSWLRYGDRSTLTWAAGKPLRLSAGPHTLQVLLKDPTGPAAAAGTKAYFWSFDAAAFARCATPQAPVSGQTVTAPQPELHWSAPPSATRFTVQVSQEPDFSGATLTVGGLKGDHYTLPRPVADGAYYWRIKALEEQESPYPTPFSSTAAFTVNTPASAISKVRVVARGPSWATIAWRTDAPCRSGLTWGISPVAMTHTAASPATAASHRVNLSGLQPMTYYYYTLAASGSASTVRRGFCTTRGPIADHNSPFGIFGQGLTYSRELGAAGAKWYSDYWDWATLEPSRGKFDFTHAEQRIQRAQESGVDLSVTFWGSPAWVRPGHPDKFTHGPENLQDARDFFRAIAEHCRGRVDWWLPWIEPNVGRDVTFGFPEGYWAGRPHARSYAAYQRAASEGARAGDPNCRVVGMNTAGLDLDFIRKCYDEGAADDFDVMNVHYYAIGEPFERQNPEAQFAGLRALMSEYGDAEKPIICSEGGGASSGVPGTTEDTQADNLIRIYVISIADNIDKLCWTFELDEKPYGSDRVDMTMWMGLFRFDPKTTPDNPVGQPKPSFYAFRTMTGTLYGTQYAGRLPLGPNVRAYRFTAPGKRVTVAWAEKDEATVTVPCPLDPITLIDRKGNQTAAQPQQGNLTLKLTGSPVFVVQESAHKGVRPCTPR